MFLSLLDTGVTGHRVIIQPLQLVQQLDAVFLGVGVPVALRLGRQGDAVLGAHVVLGRLQEGMHQLGDDSFQLGYRPGRGGLGFGPGQTEVNRVVVEAGGWMAI